LDRAELQNWIERYERAWRTPGSDPLADLFAEDASYSTAPYEEAHVGLEAIRRMWEAERLGGPDEDFVMESEVVAVEGDTGVARITVNYGPPREQEYRDLWVVTLDLDGRCTQFEEWPFWPPGTDGTSAGGGVAK
jgi:ketosteroid isomerase-like protein